MASDGTDVPPEQKVVPLEKGIVKQILSGDSIIVRGPPRGGPPPERQISFTNVIAPKLARFNPADQTYSDDEPYAWECREYLRKKLIGKEVHFRIEYRVPGGGSREYGYVFLKNAVGEMENITESLMKLGLIRCRNPANKQFEDQVELERLQEIAKGEAVGIWSEEKNSHTREIIWEVDHTFVERNKGQQMSAIIERVRDGSTMRAFILPTPDDPKYKDISCMLTGIKCPRVPREGDSDPGEPYNLEAKYFTESRLLHREIKILIEGKLNNENSRNKQLTLLGTIVHPMGNISELLLKEGFARCVDWSIVQLQSGCEKYRGAEKSAKEKKLRMWKDYTPSTASLSVKDKEFTGKVVEVVNGDAIVVRDPSGVDKKIFFASFRAPRPQAIKEEVVAENGLDPGRNAKRGRPLYDIPHMFEAREFLRKKLVGKKVKVVVDFVKPPNDGYPERICATIFVNEINVAEALVSKGLGTAVRYGQDDDQRSSCYDALLQAEERAKKNFKGVFARKEWVPHKIADLSGDVSKSRQFLPFLQRAGKTPALVEFVASGSRFRLYLPKETCLLTFLLAGISCPRARATNPAVNQPPNNQTPEEDACGAKALSYSKEICLQRDVEVRVDQTDKGGNFIGWLFVDNVNMSVALVEHGLSKVHFTAERSEYYDQLTQAESRAKAKKIGVWENFVEAAPVEQVIVAEETERKTNYKKVIVSEVSEGVTFFAQSMDNAQAFEQMMTQMRKELTDNPPLPGALATPKRGMLVASTFSEDGQWYRAKVEKIEKGDKITVLYVDYGNREVISCTKLAPLPAAYSSMPSQAREYSLALLKMPPDEENLHDVTNAFAKEALYKEFSMNLEYKFDGRDFVTLSNPDLNLDLGRDLLSNGVVLLEMRKDKRLQSLVQDYQVAQSEARKKRLNLWRYGDFTEDDAPEFGSK